jgi:hypothetical protein
MKRFFTITLYAAFAVVVSSCKPTTPSLSAWGEKMDEMYDCHMDAGLDSTELAMALVGTWDWEYVRSVAWTSYESDDTYEGFQLTLEGDGTFIMNQNDTASIDGTWQLENSWVEFSLTTQPYAQTLSGALLHCDGYIMFYSSPADGPDHIYKKQ